MMRLVVLGLLACAVSLSYSAVIIVPETSMPVMWAEATGELPKQNDVYIPSAFNALHRMSLYKLMISATDLLMISMGIQRNENPMWGLALQLSWMKTSGRLADPNGGNCGTDADPLCISPESWWGCENFLVSVLPFLSAAHTDTLAEGMQVQMQMPEGISGICTTHPECSTQFPDAMGKWDAFFSSLIPTGSGNKPDAEKKDITFGLYWDAQMASIVASQACDSRKILYPAAEQTFMKTWLGLTDLVAAVRFQSNLANATRFIAPLPSDILQNDDVPTFERFPAEEKKLLKTFMLLDTFSFGSDSTVVDMWRKAMCSMEARKKGAILLNQILETESNNTLSFGKILSTMAFDGLLQMATGEEDM